MSRYHWRPSKAEAKEFAEKMDEIKDYCQENGISRSLSSDSYYFSVNGVDYRVSNHSVESSKFYHPNGREKDVIYIHASKTRLIEIHKALLAGKKLDGRGYEK